ncbi:SPFH domain-containing protein [Chitinimonas sp. BJB300]|uniref:SPFH domain-containing protein n=1 Tax=Chitinimonas sp. BJB300 TaxID=1559339 RepID=UPI000C0D1750|nr:SPFH domain-containing protein [Chitinimonas sp. BJB300]PHV12264.1 antifreeze protein [Chitinimonas sp. BJB300]TSJ84776.1 SPFH domain-containing protein [Chitinimonas sp. BJB300]
MSLWSKLTAEFIDIVEWTEDRPDVLVHRFDRYQNEIKMGAKLTVREGQLAVMVNEGQLGKGQVADVFAPGMYTLSTENMPLLSTLKGWKYGFNSPFKAEVYFFNTKIFTDLKWGTPGPATMRDPEFGVVRVTSFGLYAIRVKDPKTMLVDLVGTKAEFTVGDIEENLRGKVGTRIKEVMPEAGVPVIDLESKVTLLGERIREKISADFEKFGLELTEVQVQDIGLPEEVEKAIDQQGAMRAIGNMQQFGQYQAAQAMREAAQNPGTVGGVMGLGVGMGLNQAMGGLFQQPAASGATTPPPLPTQAAFFVAMNGQQTGPFDMATLQSQAQAGQLGRDTLIWKQGMVSWAAAGEQAELANLFAQTPPPLPPQ